MDGSTFGKGISSLSSCELSAVPEPSPFGSWETNENVMIHDQINSKLHNQKKAASKTVIREKNILGERNDDDDEQKSSFVADSSSNQYDPLTNYLSPRPKYLRYKPNRRREIFLHLENRCGEGNDGLGVDRSIAAKTKAFVGDEGSMEQHAKDSPPPLHGGNVHPENDETLNKGDSDNEENDEVLENESENDEIPENEEDVDDDYNDEAVDSEEDEDEEEEYVEDNRWSSNWLMKLLLITVILLLSPLFASLMEYPPSSPTVPVMDSFDDININPVLGVLSIDMNRSLSDSQNKIEVSSSSLDQRDVGIEPDEVELEDEDEMFSGTSKQEVAVPEIWLSDQEPDKEIIETDDTIDNNEAEAFDQLPIFEPAKSILHSERHSSPNASEIQECDQVKDDEVVLVEPTPNQEEFLETQMEADEDIDDETGVPENMADSIYSKLQQIVHTTPAALAILLSLISTYAIYLFSARPGRRISQEHTKPAIEPPLQKSTRAAEVLTTVILDGKNETSRPDMATNQLPNVVYAAEASSLFRSAKDSSELFSHTKTQEVVELLGELVIGEVSSNLRTTRKTRLPETQENSSYSFSQVSGSRHLHPPFQPSALLESATSEKKKEGGGGKDGEAKKVITTPLRRSSRIRNRSPAAA